MSHPETIAAHGGVLIDRIAPADRKQEFLAQADDLPRLTLDDRHFSDLVLIAIGAASPLTGFMGQADYETTVTDMRLANGLPWSVPITLSVSTDEAAKLTEGQLVRLDYSSKLLMRKPWPVILMVIMMLNCLATMLQCISWINLNWTTDGTMHQVPVR